MAEESNRWLRKLKVFGESTAVKHDVAGESENFYPLSVGKVLELRTLAGPLAKAFSVLLSSSKTDTGAIYREVGEPTTDEDGNPVFIEDASGNKLPIRDSENISEPITPELAKLRSEQSQEAISMVMDALGDPANMRVLADIIMDSLRWPNSGDDKRPDLGEFISVVPLPAMIEYLIGVCKANGEHLRPLTGALSPALSQLQGNIGARLSAVTTES